MPTPCVKNQEYMEQKSNRSKTQESYLFMSVPEDIFLVLMSLSGGVFQAFANLAQTPIPLEIVGCLAQTLGSTGNWLSTKASHLSSDHQF